MSVRVLGRRCPRCDSYTDGRTEMDDGPAARPGVGDINICAYCGMVEVFRESGQLSAMTAAEWNALPYAERIELLGDEDRRRRVMGWSSRSDLLPSDS